MSPPAVLATLLSYFFFHDTPPTEIYTLSLHDALPISSRVSPVAGGLRRRLRLRRPRVERQQRFPARHQCLSRRRPRSEEHTSELQSHSDLVCRLLLEKKKKKNNTMRTCPISCRHKSRD